MRRKFPCLLTAAAIFTASVLSGCELMPVEEAPPAVPIVNEYSGPEYEQVTVLRGDMVLKREIPCAYTAAVSENYAFPAELEGTKIAAVYVQEGQTVTKGTLLAELDNASINGQISTQQAKIDDQKTKIRHMEEDRALDLKLQDALIAQYRSQHQLVQAEIDALVAWEADPAAGPRPTDATLDKLQKQAQNLQQNMDKQIANRQSVVENYQTRLLNAEDALAILVQRLEELQATLATRQLVAQMDGVVTHADTIMKQPKVKLRTTVTITDMSTVSFRISDPADVAFLTVGAEVQMKIGSKTYAASVTEKIPAGEDTTDEIALLQVVAEDAPEVRIGYVSTVTVVEASKTDVLYVDASTVKSGADGKYVFVIGEDGLKTRAPVTTGITSDNMTEITEGLAEGDKVIKE